jgi:hypothetical protein
MTAHGCERMDYFVNYRCPDHPDPFECPDNLVHYSKQTQRYGLIIHDGGNSFVTIGFCPWCGARLPCDESA